MSNVGETVLVAQALAKSFVEGDRTLAVLTGIDFSITRGERVAIVGASGSGKTTLLQLMGGLDTPTSGEVFVDGVAISTLSDVERGQMRNRSLGFVYQFHHLLPEFTALENVAMPLLIRGESPARAQDAARELLAQVGLEDRLRHRPAQLSGGERQRTAIARALVARPAVVLADEPTGNLDRRTGERVFELLLSFNKQFNTSLIVVTHDSDIAARMDRVFELEDGRLTETQADAA